jgi:hypothetical protein
VRENVRIDSHRPLSLRGWVRTALSSGPGVCLGLILFDGNGNYLGQEDSAPVAGQSQWTRLEATLSEGTYPQAAFATVMCSVKGESQGTVWFDDLRLEQAGPYGRLNLPGGAFETWEEEKTILKLPSMIRHNVIIESKLQYTPQNKWQNQDRVRLQLVANYKSGYNVWLQMFGADRTGSFYDQRSLAPSFQVRTFEVSGNGKIAGQTVPLRAGRMRLNYSPYLLTMTDDKRDNYQYKHGLSAERFSLEELGSLDLFGFSHSSSQLTLGGRHTFSWRKIKAASIYYRLTDTSFKAQQEYGGLSLSAPLPASQALAVNWAMQNKDLALDKKAQILLTELNGKLPQLAYTLRYYDFDAAFDPPYRDRLPQFDTNAMTITAWNPVDRYRGKSGLGLTLKSNDKKLNATVEYDRYREDGSSKDRSFGNFATKLADYGMQAGYLVKGEWNRNLYDMLGYYLQYKRWNLTLTRALSPQATLGASYESEDYRSQERSVGELFGQYRFSGALNGLRLKLGLENSRTLGLRRYAQLNWTLPNRLSVLWRVYQNPQPAGGFDPVSERYLDHDSLFTVKLSASFS